jgi:hypothetical protein
MTHPETLPNTPRPIKPLDPRWHSNAIDKPLWHLRTDRLVTMLAELLARENEPKSGLYFLDLGCGLMHARRALANAGLDYFYVPSDIVSRGDGTHVADLNEAQDVATLPRCDITFLGGALEHVTDPIGLLGELAARTRYLAFSYCYRTSTQDMRERIGWVSHVALDDVHATFDELATNVSFDSTHPNPKPLGLWVGKVRPRGER